MTTMSTRAVAAVVVVETESIAEMEAGVSMETLVEAVVEMAETVALPVMTPPPLLQSSCLSIVRVLPSTAGGHPLLCHSLLRWCHRLCVAAHMLWIMR